MGYFPRNHVIKISVDNNSELGNPGTHPPKVRGKYDPIPQKLDLHITKACYTMADLWLKHQKGYF